MQLFRLFIVVFFVIFLSACKKEQSPEQQDKGYVQYFTGEINGKNINIKTQTTTNYNQCNDCNTESIAGDWTGYPGVGKEGYTVSVMLSKDNPEDFKMPQLKFRIFDIKTGVFDITGEEDIYDPLASFIVVVKKNNVSADNTFYAPAPQKESFKIAINRYEFKPDSGLPFVGGKLNGILYNTQNKQDSIVLKDCNFEVRY